MSPRRVAHAATWIVPAAVLALSGAAKLLDPSGTAPTSVARLTGGLAWATVLRLVGAVELAAAALLLAPRTRLAARYVAFTMLAGFSAFVAWNAADARFVDDCGCMGWVRVSGRDLGGVPGMLLRNAALLFLVAWGAYMEGRRAVPLAVAASHAGVAAALVFLGLLWLGERVEVDHLGRVSAAAALGRSRAAESGWKLPDLALTAEDGRSTRALQVLRGRDHLQMFSTRCPHCRRAAPQWAALGRRLEGEGARLVLLAADESGGSAAEFARECGCDALPRFVLEDPLDAQRLGIRGVPEMLVLDEERRVVHQPSATEAPSLAADVAAAERSVPGLEPLVWERLAAAAFGPGAHLVGSEGPEGRDRATGPVGPGSPKASRGAEDVRVLRVQTAEGREGRLIVAASPDDPAYALELAVGLDDRDTIVAVLPLAEGGLVHVVAPSFPGLEGLRGLTLAAAASKAALASREARLDSHVWTSVAKALRRVERAAKAP